jgi:hydroxypyruvate isomerase
MDRDFERFTGEPCALKGASTVREGDSGKELRKQHLAGFLPYIMEGDVIRTIRDAKDYIAHYHTGGNPGRNEIDETQELNYSAIVKAIVGTGYKGYLGQEFIPKRDPEKSLAQAFRICDV